MINCIPYQIKHKHKKDLKWTTKDHQSVEVAQKVIKQSAPANGIEAPLYLKEVYKRHLRYGDRNRCPKEHQ